jgi:hypothetical protein
MNTRPRLDIELAWEKEKSAINLEVHCSRYGGKTVRRANIAAEVKRLDVNCEPLSDPSRGISRPTSRMVMVAVCVIRGWVVRLQLHGVCLPRIAVFSRNAQTFLVPLWNKVVSGIYSLKINELYSSPMLRANYRSGGTDSLKASSSKCSISTCNTSENLRFQLAMGIPVSDCPISRFTRSLPAQTLFWLLKAKRKTAIYVDWKCLIMISTD